MCLLRQTLRARAWTFPTFSMSLTTTCQPRSRTTSTGTCLLHYWRSLSCACYFQYHCHYTSPSSSLPPFCTLPTPFCAMRLTTPPRDPSLHVSCAGLVVPVAVERRELQRRSLTAQSRRQRSLTSSTSLWKQSRWCACAFTGAYVIGHVFQATWHRCVAILQACTVACRERHALAENQSRPAATPVHSLACRCRLC
jgi:hypothetical protein